MLPVAFTLRIEFKGLFKVLNRLWRQFLILLARVLIVMVRLICLFVGVSFRIEGRLLLRLEGGG